MLHQLWNDDVGALYATEYVLLSGLTVFGLLPGLVALRNATNSSLKKQAETMERWSGCQDADLRSVQVQSQSQSQSQSIHLHLSVPSQPNYLEQAP